MEVIRFRSHTDSIEANIARAKLQSEEIPCFLSNENFSILQANVSGNMSGGIDLMIREEDIETAMQILNEKPESAYVFLIANQKKS